VSASNWNIGDVIQERWEVRRILQGGMGIVYIVYDRKARDVFSKRLNGCEHRLIAPSENHNGIQIHQPRVGGPRRTGEERGIYAASTSANPTRPKWSRAVRTSHREAT